LFPWLFAGRRLYAWSEARLPKATGSVYLLKPPGSGAAGLFRQLFLTSYLDAFEIALLIACSIWRLPPGSCFAGARCADYPAGLF